LTAHREWFPPFGVDEGGDWESQAVETQAVARFPANGHGKTRNFASSEHGGGFSSFWRGSRPLQGGAGKYFEERQRRNYRALAWIASGCRDGVIQ